MENRIKWALFVNSHMVDVHLCYAYGAKLGTDHCCPLRNVLFLLFCFFFIKAMLTRIVTTSIKAAFTSNRCFLLLNLTIWYHHNKKADQTRPNWTGLVRDPVEALANNRKLNK